MSWEIVYTKQAVKDSAKIESAGYKPKVVALLKILKENPRQNPPSYEKLLGDLTGAFSRRINIQHRLIYQIDDELHTVKILRMWTHYE